MSSHQLSPEQVLMEIAHDSGPYRLARELRNQVLSLPLNLDPYHHDLEAEASQLNFGPHQCVVKAIRA